MTVDTIPTPPDSAARSTRRTRKPHRESYVRRARLGLIWFAVPALVFYVFVVVVPSVRGVGFAFTDWTGGIEPPSFVGFDNFAKIFRDPAAVGALWHTAFIAFVNMILQNAIGLLLALGVHSKIKSRNLLRVFFFAPAVVAPVATAYLFQFLFSPEGPINSALEGLGLGFLKQDWLGNPNIVLWSVVIVLIWQFAGYSMVIFLAGLEGVPPELMEAAALDGAGPIRKFWSVVRPLLAPAITINLMLSVIGGLKLFDQVYVMTGGGPGDSSQTISTLIYKNAFQFNEFSYSIAMAVLMTILVAVISLIQYSALSRQGR
jgi:raffinose/stachyose/melibiose transport system permease protein